MGIFNFVKNVFRYNSASKIKYDGSLIKKFKKDHQKLLKIYTNMLELHERGMFMELKKEMKNFRVTVSLHVLEEDKKLYSYLIQSSKGNQDEIDMHQAVHDEMKTIIKVVSDFFDSYEHGLLGSPKDKFRADLEKIGETLVDRIEREEESLYTLYI